MNTTKTQFWTQGVPVEYEALRQIEHIAALPIVAGHLAIMPDVHLGKGATVGSVIPTRSAIIPAAVGVDIGCGMCALKTDLGAADLPESLSQLRSAIEDKIPVGFAAHEKPVSTRAFGLEGQQIDRQIKSLRERFQTLAIVGKLSIKENERVWSQLGTLGGGNHFIEVCLDENDGVWLMLHSGSRHIGNAIGQKAIGMAREAALKANVRLPDKDLAWLDEGSTAFESYIEGLLWAQDYAALNRKLMLLQLRHTVEDVLGKTIATGDKAINCHHNYASRETHFGETLWITRKGAVSAKAGQLGIIPGSMGAKSFIVKGKGNPDSYCSCSHGAGRKMSRSAAKKSFSVQDLQNQTANIECRKDFGVIDEIPSAYKDIDAVIAAQADLIEVTATLKQVLCIKG